MLNRKYLFAAIIIIVSVISNFAQSSFYQPNKYDNVQWSHEDFGKMWTFDNVPVEQFKKKYNFEPTEEWLNTVQKSALQFGGGCSAAFVSEDGLIMTNHHCARNRLASIQKEGENLLKDGFYAKTLEEERKLENLFVDQLVFIKDVTKEISEYMNNGKDDNEKIKLREDIKDSLVQKYNKDTGLKCKIVTLYYGGKYSVYGYKRYTDIRLVMSPDFQIAATGWDWDNFTYPRYELDFMFFRAYDKEGKPIKTNNFFKWSKQGAVEDEPIFVIGRPGSTDRLLSVSQLEYFRDHVYPFALIGFNSIYYAYFNLYQKHPEREELLNRVMGWGNARKSYAGRLAGLKNNFIMKKKKSFENELIEKIHASPKLSKKYNHLWSDIDSVLNKLSYYSKRNIIVRFSRFIKPVYYKMAKDVIKIARQKQLTDEERNEDYKSENLAKTIETKYPEKIDTELEDYLLQANVEFVTKVLGPSNFIVEEIFDNKLGEDAVEFLKGKSLLTSKESFLKFAHESSENILNSKDPFVKYVLEIEKESKSISKTVKELNNSLAVLNQQLGEVVYKVFGDQIPPDATSTLRISDGVIKGYEYNGTIAPGKTTFYGLWDRYISFGGKTYPWGLHERWKTPPKELELSKFIGFASTNDIVGGNSGSSVINRNKEVVGLVHDGNIESLAGSTIFLEENNRTVATDSDGLLESLKYVYKTKRLVNELLNGKIE